MGEGVEVAPHLLATVDRMLGRVVFFGADGQFRRAVGRLGDGPGEFRMPAALTPIGGGMIAVSDPAQMRIAILDTLGTPFRSYRTRHFAGEQIASLPRGQIAVGGMGDDGGGYRFVTIYDSTGTEVRRSVDVPKMLSDLTPRVSHLVLLSLGGEKLLVINAIAPQVVVVAGDAVERRDLDIPADLWHQLPQRTSPAKTLGEMKARFDSASVFGRGAVHGDSAFAVAWRSRSDDGSRYFLGRIDMQKSTATVMTDVPGWVLGFALGRVWVLAEQLDSANVLETYSCTNML